MRARLRARLHAEKKSQSVVGYSKLNQSCEDPISHPDVDNQRT